MPALNLATRRRRNAVIGLAAAALLAIALSTGHFGSKPSVLRSSAKISGWSHKAVPSERAASQIVGGFSAQERRRYEAGLKHVERMRSPLGSFTIAELVAQGTRRRAHRSSGLSRAQWIALYSIAGFLIFTVMMSSQKRRAERNALLARWNSQDAENPERVALPSGFIPNFGERVLYSSEADCWLPKAVSVSTGQIRGIAFGMLGAAETSSESVDKNLTKHVGIGILVVTNRRIIVCAGNDVAQWPIGSVVTTEILDTRRELHSQWPARLVMRIANAGIATFSVSYVPALRDSLRLSITGEA